MQILRGLFEALSRAARKSDAGRKTFSHREVLVAGNVGPELSEKYIKRLGLLDNVVRDCITVSKRYAGINSPTAKHFYASVLFTSLISRAVSLAILAPHSPWANKLIEHWDYASASVIVRTMIELRAAFHYLCVDECSDDEWSCRWNLLNLHDCVSRKRLIEARGADLAEVTELNGYADELRDRLKANIHFLGLAHQQKLLHGQSAYLYPMEDMLERAGVKKDQYRYVNILFSSHVHGLPMSYYRMGHEERGRGLPSPIEEDYTILCLSLAANLLVHTRDDAHALFKGLPKEAF